MGDAGRNLSSSSRNKVRLSENVYTDELMSKLNQRYIRSDYHGALYLDR